MRCCLLIFLALSQMAAAAVTPVNQAQIDADFQRFIEWFPGEYDNHEQVWQEGLDDAEHPHEHLHHIFAPVDVASMADGANAHTFFVQQYQDADPQNVYRQRLYVLSIDDAEQAILLKIYSFIDEEKYRNAHLDPKRINALEADELKTWPGCEVYWKYGAEGYFSGYMKEGACTFKSERSGNRITVTDDLRLTADEIWIRDEAFNPDGSRVYGHPERIHHKNRKVRYFTGWSAIKLGGPAAKEEEAWHFTRDLLVHNEGQIIPIVDEQGSPSGYSFQLARLTYQNTAAPILKLGLIDDKTGETVTYVWANTDAQRIGFNLRWAQVGLTLQPNRSKFGFDTGE